MNRENKTNFLDECKKSIEYINRHKHLEKSKKCYLSQFQLFQDEFRFHHQL